VSTILLALILAGIDPKAPVCVRWTWEGPVYNRKVTCLEWKKTNPSDKGKQK